MMSIERKDCGLVFLVHVLDTRLRCIIERNSEQENLKYMSEKIEQEGGKDAPDQPTC